MKTGVLGGTFDPIHNGHVRIAEEAMKKLRLDEVLFIPAAISPFKTDVYVTPVRYRVKMVELAVEGIPGFRLSQMEIDRPGTSYTADTLEILSERADKANELYFIIGLDSLKTLPRWKDPDRIVRLARIVTIRRPGVDIPHIEEVAAKVPGLKDRLILLDEPLIDISSTDIRQRIQDGLPVRNMLPPKVEQYIRKNALYRRGK